MAVDEAQTPLTSVTTESGIATICLDSSHNRNALSIQLMSELSTHLKNAVDDPQVRAIVLTHTGPVFCSGMDLKGTAAQAGAVSIADFPDLLSQFWTCPKPTIAKIAGPARAGGLGLIAACDFAAATTEATFAFSEVRIGVVPAVISATVLPRLTPRIASELFLTGAVFKAERAVTAGLITAAVPAVELDATVGVWTEGLRRAAPNAVAATKVLLRTAPAETFDAKAWDERLDELSTLSSAHFTSDEGREGVAAFRQKRDPEWVVQ